MTDEFSELETPCLIADRSRIEANAARMQERVQQFDVELRPHLKTTKSAAIARIAHGGDTGPVTVSTLREAEYFLANGFTDITYAVALTPNKFEHAARLNREGGNLKVLVSDAQVARALADYCDSSSSDLTAMLEIDSGEHRTGFKPGEEPLLAAARTLHGCERVLLGGLLTHGGHSYQCATADEIVAVADQERSSLQTSAAMIKNTGIPLGTISSGSTPTAVHGRNFDGIDEIRPGVYLAGDLFQAQLGVCDLDDIAISVLATVIAHDHDRNRLVIDAGALALSKDRSTEKSAVDYGYGLLAYADGTRMGQNLIVAGVHQEHGEVQSVDPLPFVEMPVGSQVRVLPNHACMMAAPYDRYFVTDGPGTAIADQWDKVSGW